jgi:rare lipoprotein A (peptidoglycan hydrolase)
MSYATQNQLLVPNSNWDYLPNQALTRGELADILYREMESPMTETIEFGVASYYADYFHGRSTASGAILDVNAPMAAHPSLPFGTMIRVTNLANNQSVNLEVLDRGPYLAGRIVDLTPWAFEEIGHLGSGILNVRLEVLQ